MAENDGAEGANDSGGAKATEQGKQDDRAKWTPEQWADFTQRESDRLVSEAQKKWRDDLAAQLTAKDKDAETRISAVLEQAKQAEARAEFAERATDAGISDVRAAWAVVKEYGLANDKGLVDFKKLKDAHPALFGIAVRQSVAGKPGDVTRDGKTDMTALLRRAARGA